MAKALQRKKETELKDTLFNVDEFRVQVEREYQMWYWYVAPKRQQYYNRIRKWNRQTNNKKKILNINLISQAIDVAVSVSYSDALSVRFVSRDWRIHQEEADNLQYLADFDNNEEDYQQLKYQAEWDRLFYGVSLRYRSGYDKTKKTPVFNVIDPLTRIPDPNPTQIGKFNCQNFRFHWFEFEVSFFDLKNAEYSWKKIYEEQDLANLISLYSANQQQIRNEKAVARNYWCTTTDSRNKNFSLWVYYHLTIYNGKKYFSCWTADRLHLLRVYEYLPILKEEKQDNTLIPREIAVSYFKPRRNDAFGESMCDMLEDKQNWKSILANLNIMKAQREARGGRFVVNSRLIRNKDSVLNSSPFEQYRFTSDDVPDQDLKNAMYEVPQSIIAWDSYNMMSFIDQEARMETGVDQLQMGIIPDKAMTKAEAQQAQANNNLRSLLRNSIASRWERYFRFLWYRTYQEFFSSADKKVAILNINFEWKSITLTKDQFTFTQSPYIIVWTKAELDSVDEQQKQFFTVQVLPLLQSPLMSEIWKKFLIRRRFKLNKMKDPEIYTYIGLDGMEKIAKSYLDIVNMGKIPESLFSNPQIDYSVMRIYLQKAEESEAKYVVLSALEQILIQQWMNTWIQWSQQAANSATNIAMSQAMSWMWNQLQTRADVLPS